MVPAEIPSNFGSSRPMNVMPTAEVIFHPQWNSQLCRTWMCLRMRSHCPTPYTCILQVCSVVESICCTRSPHSCCNIHYWLLTDPLCVCVLVHVCVCIRMCLCLCVCLWNPQIKVVLPTGHFFLKIPQPQISSSTWNSSCLFASLFEIHRIIKVKAWRCLRD